MPQIEPPTTTPDHPDHVANCAEAIDIAYPVPRPDAALVAQEAMDAGWDEDTVKFALAELESVEAKMAEGEHHEPR